MTSSLALLDPALFATAFGVGGAAALAPLAREIHLVDVQVAGTSYRQLERRDPTLATLEAGTVLRLVREAGNEHDELAVRVLVRATGGGGTDLHVGYVPRPLNAPVARLLDAGKLLTATLLTKEWQGRWLRLGVRIALRDLGVAGTDCATPWG